MEYIVWGVVDWMRAATMSLISLYSSGEVTKPGLLILTDLTLLTRSTLLSREA